MEDANPYRLQGADHSRSVQAIRMAIALNERFGELLKQTLITSSEQMELRLGEARQIYPEIWSNLDAAHANLARGGVDVARYVELRDARAIEGGVLDVQVDGVAIVGRRGMSAWLNEPGHAAANEAARVLQSALPHVDWDALDRADADAMAAIGSLGPSRAKKLVFGVFALIAMALAIGAIIAFKFRRQIDAHGAPGHEINIDVKIPEVKFDGEALGRQLNESAKKQWESRPRVPPPTLHLPSPAQLSDEKPPQSN